MKLTHPSLMEMKSPMIHRCNLPSYNLKIDFVAPNSLGHLKLFPTVESGRKHFLHRKATRFFFAYLWVCASFCFKKKRLSDLSNQSHDSQVSNSTLSANSNEDRHNMTAPSQREDLVDGNSVQEEELDEMEVEYIEVKFSNTLLCMYY